MCPRPCLTLVTQGLWLRAPHALTHPFCAAGASGNLANAMKDCGGRNNTQCTSDISFVVADVARMSGSLYCTG